MSKQNLNNLHYYSIFFLFFVIIKFTYTQVKNISKIKNNIKNTFNHM